MDRLWDSMAASMWGICGKTAASTGRRGKKSCSSERCTGGGFMETREGKEWSVVPDYQLVNMHSPVRLALRGDQTGMASWSGGEWWGVVCL